MQFSLACALFDIEWSSPFQLNIWGKVTFSFLGLAKSDIKVLLQKLCAHRLYSIATAAKRKDVSPAEGFFDKQASTGSFKWFSKQAPEELLLQHLQSMMVGCTPTADRTYAAGTSTTSSCRFCDVAKEDTFHLVHNCPALPAHLERPSDDFWLGPNFQLLGLVETPWTDVTERLQISSTTEILVEEWSGHDAPPVHLWTDGSVVLSKSYWKTRSSLRCHRQQHMCGGVWESPSLGPFILHSRAFCNPGRICFSYWTLHHPHRLLDHRPAISRPTQWIGASSPSSTLYLVAVLVQAH